MSWVLGLIFYAGMVVVAAWFLAFGSRRPLSKRREPFRKPARMRALGLMIFAGCGVLTLAVGGTSNDPPFWPTIVEFLGIAGSLWFLIRGARAYSRAADAYPPGKHADPSRHD